jgi:Ca2+-binding RTX toxin-like protein
VLAKGASTVLLAIAALLLAVSPAIAQGGISVSFGPAGNGTYALHLSDEAPEANQLAIVTVVPSGGAPDLVFGDRSAGISGPLPPFCFIVDPTIFRCPASMIGGLEVNLGPGNDTLSAKEIDAALNREIALRYINANLAKGRDVAVGGPVRNVIIGGPGRDMLMGGPLGDKLFGGGQNDFLVGLGGSDLFQCGSGNQDLFNDGPGKDLVNVRTCEDRTHRQFLP